MVGIQLFIGYRESSWYGHAAYHTDTVAYRSIVQNKISMHMSGQDKNKANDQAAAMSKAMVWMMPAMSVYFTLILPAGLGVYWIVSSLIQIVQQIVLYYYFEKKGEDLVVKVPEKKQHNHRKKGKKR